MKTFLEYIREEGESALPANSISGGKIAGTIGDPPVNKQMLKKYKETNSLFRRKLLQK